MNFSVTLTYVDDTTSTTTYALYDWFYGYITYAGEAFSRIALERMLAENPNAVSGLKLPALKHFLLEKTSWHHPSLMYNHTDFYSISEEMVDSISKETVTEWADYQEPKNEAKTYRGDFDYIEWSGTRKHPKANKISLKDVNISEIGSFYVVTDDLGNEIAKKKIGSNGTAVVNYEERDARSRREAEAENAYRINSSAAAYKFYSDMDGREYSQSDHIYEYGKKPTRSAYEDGLDKFFNVGDKRIFNDRANNRYILETWDGEKFVPEDVGNASIKDSADFFSESEKDGLKPSLADEEYDFSKSFAEQIKDLKKGTFPKRDTMILGGTPEVFINIGLLPLPVSYTQQHAKDAIKNTDGDHLGENLLKQVPTALEKPIAIIDSETVPGRIVAILELKEGNNNVIAAVEIEGTGMMHGQLIDSNLVVSLHSRENAIKRLMKNAIVSEINNNKGIYYLDKKRATALAIGVGVQFPAFSSIASGYVHSITEFSKNVNRFLKNIFDTKQFKRWFGNSKVVNEDGTPRVMYHGSNSEFTIFKREMLKDRTGFFFTSSMKEARQYGNPKQYYLSIQNPIDIDSDVISKYANLEDADELIKALERDGYDGMYYKSGNNEWYIAFYPTQIKSATDNIGTFDRSNPDIRYSLADSPEDSLRKQIAYLKNETRLTPDNTMSPKDALNIAKDLLRDYSGDLTKDGLAQDLINIRRDLLNAKTEEEIAPVEARIFRIANDIVNSSYIKEVTPLDETGKDIRSFLKGNTYYLSEQYRNDIGDYNSFRRHNQWRFKLGSEGTSVDVLYAGLQEQFGTGYFPDIAHPADQALYISELLDRLHNVTEYIPYSVAKENAVNWQFKDIITRLREAENYNTLADRMQAEIYEMREQRDIALKSAAEDAKKEILKAKNELRAKEEANRLKKNESEARQKLLKVVQRLKRIKTDSASRALIEELIGDIDDAAVSLGRGLANKEGELRGLRDLVTELKEKYPDFVPDNKTAKAIERLEKKRIANMELGDVVALTDTLLAIETGVRNTRLMIEKSERREFRAIGETIINEQKGMPAHTVLKDSGALSRVAQWEFYNSLSPMRFAETLSNYDQHSRTIPRCKDLKFSVATTQSRRCCLCSAHRRCRT